MLFISYLLHHLFRLPLLQLKLEKILTTDVGPAISLFTGLHVKVITRARERERERERERIIFFQKPKYTDQDGNIETSIVFLIQIQREIRVKTFQVG